MQHDASVIKLLDLSEEETQRVRAREHDLHTAGCKHVRQDSRTIDEVFYKCHFIQKHIAVSVPFQCAEILVYI